MVAGDMSAFGRQVDRGSVTPGTRARTFSTRLTQAAQVMPVTARSMLPAGLEMAFMARR